MMDEVELKQWVDETSHYACRKPAVWIRRFLSLYSDYLAERRKREEAEKTYNVNLATLRRELLLEGNRVSVGEQRIRELESALRYPRFGTTAALFRRCVEMLEKRDAELRELKGDNACSLYMHHFYNALAKMDAALADHKAGGENVAR